MSKLSRLKASGFRSIREVDLEIRALNVLVGANGAGKSNLVALFRFLNELAAERLQVAIATAGSANALLHFGRRRTAGLAIDLTLGSHQYGCRLVPTDGDSLVFSSEECRTIQAVYGVPTPREWIEGPWSGHRESRLASGGGNARRVRDALSSWKTYHFHDTSAAAGLKQHVSIDDNAHLRADGSNLAAFLLMLRDAHPQHYRNIRDTVRLVAPFLKDFRLRPSPRNPAQIKLEWEHVGSDDYLDASSMSDGTLRFACLATLLMQPSPPSLVLLDEPELGLHPAAIGLLVGMMRSASVRSQVIVATQSVTLVNQLSVEEVVVVEREDEASVFRRLDGSALKGWLQDYALGELWEKNVIGGRP